MVSGHKYISICVIFRYDKERNHTPSLSNYSSWDYTLFVIIICLLGGTAGVAQENAGSSCQDRYNIGPKLIMLRMYIALMRGNTEKCREIAKCHCSFVHISNKAAGDQASDQYTSETNIPPPLSSRNTKLVTAGGNGIL